MKEPRRNPKRKASEAAHDGSERDADDLLRKACGSLTAQDIEEWQGWGEVESEPAFFNAIIRDLGVERVQVQELFTMDQTSLDAVSKPVFGLVFLFQYGPAEEEEEQPHESNTQLWFANQTTDNACATVALLNIIMNAPDIDLGQQLTEFKDATKDLGSSIRGQRISGNQFIRSIHNSFTRRMDHLNADLCLENDYDDARAQEKRKQDSSKARKRGGKKKKASLEYGYHFIAYVPCDGLVWELDGLRSKPHEIGSINGHDWTTVAKPQIEARMLQYEGSQLSFNLLAVCRNSSDHLSKTIASMAAALQAIDSRMKNNTAFVDITSADEPILLIDNEGQLAEYYLCQDDIDSARLPARMKSALIRPEWQIDEAYDMYRSFRAQLKSAMDEFRAELASADEEDRRVKNRKRDYGGALHCWAKKLAEKGVLEDIIRMTS